MKLEHVNIGGVDFLVRPGTHDRMMLEEIFVDEYYTANGYTIPHGATVLDLGGGIGGFTVFAAKNYARRIHVYEPQPESRGILLKNLEGHRFAADVHVHSEAVTVAGGSVMLSGFELMDDGVTVNTGTPRVCETGGIAVASMALKAALGMENFWDVVKLDIEGLEYDLLYSLPDLCFDKIHMFTMEFHHDDENSTKAKGQELADFLCSKGYTVDLSWAWGCQGRIQAMRHG